MILPVIHIHNMRAKSKWLLVFVSLLAITFVTFRYNFLSIQRTDEALHLFFGSRITISIKHSFANETSDVSTAKSSIPRPTKPIQICLWSMTYKDAIKSGSPEDHIFRNYGKARFSCPLNYSFVFGKRYKDSADAFVVHVKEPERLPRRRSIPLILQYDEPPLLYNVLKNEIFMQKFNYSIGYRMDSDFPNPKLAKPKTTRPLDFNQKFDYAAVIFSDCKKIRTDYVRELSKQSRIKSFGDCLRNVEKNNLVRKGEQHYIKSKIAAIKLYKFTLAFMKYDCEDYVDDQLTHAWEAGTLPVFLGTDTIFRILPGYLRSSFLSVSHFYKPENLADGLETLANSKDKYNEYMSWRDRNSQRVDNSPLGRVWDPEYSPGCQIAMKITEDRLKGDLNKRNVLQPIYCKQRNVDTWLGKDKQRTKVIDD
eukprot:Seg1363.19 transcript_id=Seg1363.19/GoldUCD/mRNA.D3Y31 product="hypothetical protein" protein_id=Seg1363.19/GoldUCD/D3Y31